MDKFANQGVTNAATKVSRTTDFDHITEALSFANSVATRLEGLADLLLGSVPQPATNGQIAESPQGLFACVAATALFTRGRLGDAMAALDRIERALPN